MSAYQNRLVILDGIHRAPDLFLTLRGLIDQGRRRGQHSGRFLLRGSASLDLLRQSGESLAGRKDLLRTYLERDVPMFGSRVPAETLRRFWTMLAHNQGALLNASRIAGGLEVKRNRAAKPARGFYEACEDLQPAKRFVVHAGLDRFPVGEGFEAVGVREMAELLERLA